MESLKLSSLLLRKGVETLFTKQLGDFEIVISAIKKGGYKHCLPNNIESLKLSFLLLRKGVERLFTKQHGEFEIVISAIKKGG